MNKNDAISWRGRDLSTDATIMYYAGGCDVRPLCRGTMLTDLDLSPEIGEVLPSGKYEIEIRVLRKLSSQE